MREYKFRAWNKLRNSMIYLGWKWSNDGDSIPINGDWDNAVDVDDLVFMQYTGLKDKNGKEIYEGDIVGEPFNGMIVTYCGDQSAGLGMPVGFYLQQDNFERWTELVSRINSNGDNYEVVGNIYEAKSAIPGAAGNSSATPAQQTLCDASLNAEDGTAQS